MEVFLELSLTRLERLLCPQSLLDACRNNELCTAISSVEVVCLSSHDDKFSKSSETTSIFGAIPLIRTTVRSSVESEVTSQICIYWMLFILKSFHYPVQLMVGVWMNVHGSLEMISKV